MSLWGDHMTIKRRPLTFEDAAAEVSGLLKKGTDLVGRVSEAIDAGIKRDGEGEKRRLPLPSGVRWFRNPETNEFRYIKDDTVLKFRDGVLVSVKLVMDGYDPAPWWKMQQMTDLSTIPEEVLEALLAVPFLFTKGGDAVKLSPKELLLGYHDWLHDLEEVLNPDTFSVLAPIMDRWANRYWPNAVPYQPVRDAGDESF